MSRERRSAEPLTLQQLDDLIDAAADMGFRYRLIVEVIPYTGLTFSEFCHLRKDWRRATGPDSDMFNIVIPLGSPCAGTLRTEPSGRDIEALEEPCWLCRDRGEWEPIGECRHRTIPVAQQTARDALNLCFDRFEMDSLPFTVSSNFYQWMDKLADKAGLSRKFGFKALRQTYGTILIRKGFTSSEVANYLGLSERFKTESLYEALDEPVDWDRRPAHRLSDTELIEALQRLTGRLNRPPMMKDIEEHLEYSYKPFYNHFGGLENALEAAGIDISEHNPQAIPREELVGELQRLADVLGHPPQGRDMREEGEYGQGVYNRHFESWDTALEAAGLDPNNVPRYESKRIGREALIEELRRLADELGRPPKQDDLQQGKYSYQPYYSMFGGIKQARKIAGVTNSSGFFD